MDELGQYDGHAEVDPSHDVALLSLPPEQIAAFDDVATVELLAAVRRCRARMDAVEARALARLDQLRAGSRYVDDEAALELRISRHAAADRVAASVDLVALMPGVLAAMDEGELDGYTARSMVDACRGLDVDDVREVDSRWIAKREAGSLNMTDPGALRRATRRLAVAVNPDAVRLRSTQARRGRQVQLVPGEDTMAHLIADLPAEVAQAAYTSVDRDARRLRNGGDERTLDQLRADVLAARLCGGPGADGATGGAMVFLHMPVTTALCMSDEACELSGYGPIPAPVAREIMTNPDSVLRAVLTDPNTGRVEGLGRRRRRPNQELRDLVAVRDRECGFCHRPAARCDVDHLTEWVADGGDTDPENLAAKCEHHHYLKDHPDWDLRTDPDTGDTAITTPAGRTYRRQPEQILEPPDPDPPPF